MRTRVHLVSGMMLGGLLLAGCLSLSELTPPEVSLIDLRFESASLLETTAIFTARVLNENPEPFIFTGGVFTITINGSRVGKGVTREVMEVPALSSVTVEVPVHLSNLPLLFQGMTTMRTEELRYGLEGKLYVKTGGGPARSLRVAKTGRFKLGGLPPSAPVPAPATSVPSSAR